MVTNLTKGTTSTCTYTLDRWAKSARDDTEIERGSSRKIPHSLTIMFMIVYPNVMYISIGQ